MWPIKPVELTTFASRRECVPTQSHPFLITKHESLILTEEQRNGWSGVCVQRHRSSFMVSRQTSCGLLLPLRPFWVSVLELGLKCSSVIWKKIPDPYIVIGFTWCYLFTRQANDLKASSWEACLLGFGGCSLGVGLHRQAVPGLLPWGLWMHRHFCKNLLL